jgi:hypothetical protein
MKRQPAAGWIESEIMGELVPPELDYLVKRLKWVNQAAASWLVIEHARKIYTAYQLWRGSPDRYGFKVSGNKRRRVERVRATRGLKDDLKRLQKVALGGSLKEWETAWLGVSGQARSLVAPPAPPIVERQLDENGKLIGFRRATPAFRAKIITIAKNRELALSSVVPHPDETLPRVEAALAEREFSREREIDKLVYTFALRVRDAYAALAGEVGITYDAHRETMVDDRLIALGKDIDRQFGTNLLSVRRLREVEKRFSANELSILRKPWGAMTS